MPVVLGNPSVAQTKVSVPRTDNSVDERFCTEGLFPCFFNKSLKASMARALRVVPCSAASIRRALHPSALILVILYAGRIGLDARTFSGHSLRSGFLTSAAANGASIFKMMDVSRHKSIDNLRTYVRDAELFKNHAGMGLL